MPRADPKTTHAQSLNIIIFVYYNSVLAARYIYIYILLSYCGPVDFWTRRGGNDEPWTTLRRHCIIAVVVVFVFDRRCYNFLFWYYYYNNNNNNSSSSNAKDPRPWRIVVLPRPRPAVVVVASAAVFVLFSPLD